MNWAIVIDMYTLMCIKWITNKNLQYKKINKIKFKTSKKKNAGEGVEKKEPSCTVNGNVNWCSHYGKQYVGFSKN